jgi:hypothetical protein
MIDGTSVFIWWNLWTRELKHDLNSFEFEGDEKRSRRGQKRLRIGWEEVEKRSRSGHKRSRRGWEEVALGRAWEEVGKRLRRGWQEVEKRLRRGWKEVEKRLKRGWKEVEKRLRRIERWEEVRMSWEKSWEDLRHHRNILQLLQQDSRTILLCTVHVLVVQGKLRDPQPRWCPMAMRRIRMCLGQ